MYKDELATRLVIVWAGPDDLALLREIAILSKGYWGYPAEWMEIFAQSPIITAQDISQDVVYMACVEGVAAGWCRLVPEVPVAILDDLWVLPAWIGRGIGGALFRHAKTQAEGLGAQAIELDADPNAVPFYEHMGFRTIGQSLTDWGRYVPHMRCDLGAGVDLQNGRGGEHK